MMEKEFEINDILNAVNTISKIERKETIIGNNKKSNDKNDGLTLNNQVKLNKSEILVLDEMIE